jgi:hypothetical protein
MSVCVCACVGGDFFGSKTIDRTLVLIDHPSHVSKSTLNGVISEGEKINLISNN